MLSLKASLPPILARQHNIFSCVIGAIDPYEHGKYQSFVGLVDYEWEMYQKNLQL
jgi:hypothetical protein